MITEDYVTYEVAKLLKEKGFDETCTHVYNIENGRNLESDFYTCRYVYNSWLDKNEPRLIAAPTLQMAMKWLREKHKIDMWVECHNSNRRYKGYIHSEQRGDEVLFYEDSYEQACEAGIKYALENLI